MLALPAGSLATALTSLPSCTEAAGIVAVLPVGLAIRVGLSDVQPSSPLVKVTVCFTPLSSVYVTSTVSSAFTFSPLGKVMFTLPLVCGSIVGWPGAVVSMVIALELVDVVSWPALS